jgi:HEAT repeat protein
LSDTVARFRAATNAEERATVALELWQSPAPDSVRTIRTLFATEQDANVKATLLVAGLGESVPESVREEFFQLIIAGIAPSEQLTVRFAAVQALVSFKDPRAEAQLRRLTEDPDSNLREAARSALETRLADMP